MELFSCIYNFRYLYGMHYAAKFANYSKNFTYYVDIMLSPYYVKNYAGVINTDQSSSSHFCLGWEDLNCNWIHLIQT